MGYQKTIIMGRLGNHPEVKETSGGTKVVNFSVAVSEKYKGEDKTEWFSCVAFSKTAELIGEYLQKGSECLIEGKMQTRSWEQDGSKRYKTELIVNSVQFIGGRAEKTQSSAEKFVVDEDSIPF